MSAAALKEEAINTDQLLAVLYAARDGDFSARLPNDAIGVTGKVYDAINDIIGLNQTIERHFEGAAASLGRRGQMMQRIPAADLRGGWRHTVEAYNDLIENIGQPTNEVVRVIGAVAAGDLTQEMPLEIEGRPLRGAFLRQARIINRMVQQLALFTTEVTRVVREVGTEGKLGGQVDNKGVAGIWKDLTDNVNSMAWNLTSQVRNIAAVTTAVANGNLSRKITVDVKGEILELKDTINTMVDQLSSFASEVTRVAREVGTEGKLGGQADVKGVAGIWKDLTDNVNSMASNLTSQVRNIAHVTTAVANGDLSKKITVDVRGEILELKDTINTMVDQLSSFASEVTRVAREVGTEGKLGGQAEVKGGAGIWKDLTDNVNSMASNLTNQVRNIAAVTTAVANGDLSKKITVDVRGEILELKDTINTMVDQLSSFASEVTRVAREVGTEGKLGGQADVKGVAGIWKDLTDNVNSMASNLTNQVRNIAHVTTSVANGDLSKKITVDVKGEILELKYTNNTMVDQLSSFASEVTRVAREVGAEGKLGGQAQVRGVAGIWKDLTDNVNSMASNLTSQVRNIAEVTTAVANGNLSKKITVDVKGEILELKNTVNTMVDQLSSFASEVTRVAREVGTEGKLGGQAEVKGGAGLWKDLTDNVNSMASNLTNQVRNIADVTTAVANGDLSKKITVDVKGEILELKNTINTMVDQLSSFASEVTRVAREVGTEGKLGGQGDVKGVAGIWKDLTDNVNSMASNLTNQVRNIAEVTTAVANGNLSKKITVDVQGEILELKNTINTMVDQLSSFASEVTRVAREVGGEGKLGGQADVKGVAGIWKDLTDSVNFMASNLTTQVRGIAQVVTAVANGDLKKQLVLEAKGEIAELSGTINSMIDTLALFGDQVTSVAREVGIEGKLGGQADVPGAAGLWRNLTDNVNELASNLTTQVRSIAEVATAVTKGDLSRSIMVEAQGEVAALKDTINEMIQNLKETTRINTEQDWLKTNLAKFTRMLQGQRNLVNVSDTILSQLSPLVSAQQGAFYIVEEDDDGPELRLLSSYAYHERKRLNNRFRPGEGLVGQCYVERERILISDVPADYIKISSALGDSPPFSIIVLPVLFEGQVRAVIELASFQRFTPIHISFMDQLTESIGIVLNTIAAMDRTEELLQQSQTLTEQLRGRQEELEQTNKRLEDQAQSLQRSEELLMEQREELQKANEELEEKARLLAVQNTEVERKNMEVEQARRSLEEKAEQLAITSRYKSEFLANMSHELRTPLNNMLLLSRLLYENQEENLSEKQIEFGRTIHSSGQDLLQLISDILDLARIESGKLALDISNVRFLDLAEYIDRTFRQSALDKALDFRIELSDSLPVFIRTDSQRLQQILRNLLSNAFKFTEEGSISVDVRIAESGWSSDHPVLSRAPQVIAFVVVDSGIGIPKDKHQVIFEAFRQADGSTSRKYGGTGLGLNISREIARLLGGEIRIESEPGTGSSFTLFLPDEHIVRPEVEEGNSGFFTLTAETVAPASGNGHRGRSVSRGPTAEMLPLERFKNELGDDRSSVVAGDRVMLIVEPDLESAPSLLEAARTEGFKGIVAGDGESALAMLGNYGVQAAVLDLRLPDMSGRTLLDRLKRTPHLRHIPVVAIAGDAERARALRFGALEVLDGPDRESLSEAFGSIRNILDTSSRRMLILSREGGLRDSIPELFPEDGVLCSHVATAAEASAAFTENRFHCAVLDFASCREEARTCLRELRDRNLDVPAVGFAPEGLGSDPELSRLGPTLLMRPAASPEAVLYEVSLILHTADGALSDSQRRMLRRAQLPDPLLRKRKVLIVDDDVRNIFALTSVLERHEMSIVYAETGRLGIERLQSEGDVDIVLMDIMMPEVDGYEAMAMIRGLEGFRNLPIIAVTARAMKGDRQKCIEAGASDYITKPVEMEQLLSMLRVWLSG